METLLTLPGTIREEPFHFFDSRKQPARCNLLVHPGQHWAIVTERPDAIGEGLFMSACMVAQAVCSKHNLNPPQLILLANYPFKGGRNVYSMHYQRGERDMFGGLVFAGPSRRAISPVDMKDVVAMLTEGNLEPSVLRAMLPLIESPLAQSAGRR